MSEDILFFETSNNSTSHRKIVPHSRQSPRMEMANIFVRNKVITFAGVEVVYFYR